MSAELEQALTRFYAPTTGNDEKRSIEEWLQQQQRSDGAIEFGCSILQNQGSSEYAQWFACSTLESSVQSRWDKCTNKEQVRNFLFQFLYERNAKLPKMVINKVSKVLVEIAIRDWPEQFPDYLTRVETLCSDGASAKIRAVGLGILLVTIEEITNDVRAVNSKRRGELRSLLRKELGGFISLVERNLKGALELGLVGNDEREEDLAVSTSFNILLQVLALVPLAQWSQCFTSDTVRILNRYMALLKSPHSVQALTCINELLDRNFVPKNMQDFVVMVAMSALEALQVLASGTPDQLELYAEGFLAQYTRLLHLFLGHHLRKVQTNSQFPVQKFLGLLQAYTLMLPDPDEFLHALEVWSVFTNLLSEDECDPCTPPELASLYLNTLLELQVQLVDRCLWSKSRNVLSMIDDQTVHDQDDAFVLGGWGQDAVDSAEGALRARSAKETELERYVRRILSLVSDIAILPNPAVAPGIDRLSMQLGSNLEECFANLHSQNLFGRGGATNSNDLVLNNVADLHWLMDITARIAPFLAFDPSRFAFFFPRGLKFLEWAMEVAQGSNAQRLFTRGPRFVSLHVAALALMSACAPWLRCVGLLSKAIVGSDGVRSKVLSAGDANFLPGSPGAKSLEAAPCAGKLGSFAGQFDGVIDQICTQALRSLDASISPPPEQVMVAAIDLLRELGTAVVPLKFFEYPSVLNLAEHLLRIAASLPVEARGMLYVALSKAVLAPINRLSSNDLISDAAFANALRERYNKLIGREAQTFVESVMPIVALASTQPGAAMNPECLRLVQQSAEGCRTRLLTLTEVAHSIDGATTFVKEFAAPSVLIALKPAVQLIEVLVMPARELATMQQHQAGSAQATQLRRALSVSMGAARSALDFVVQVLHSLGRQAGRQVCQDAVSHLVSLFAQNATAASLAQTGNGGTMLLLKLFRLLVVLMDEPTAFFKGMLSSILKLCFDELPPVIAQLTPCVKPTEQQSPGQNGNGSGTPGGSLSEVAIDLLEAQYELLHRVLRQHWKNHFFTGNFTNGAAPTFKSEESRRYFFRAMELLLDSFSREDVSPNLLKANLAVFDDLNKTHRLYAQPEFRDQMRPAFLKSLLHLLIGKSHQILEEELLVTIFGLADVDLDGFFTLSLPQFVSEYASKRRGVQLPNQTVQEIVALMPVSAKDMPTFTVQLHEFASDYAIYLANIS